MWSGSHIQQGPIAAVLKRVIILPLILCLEVKSEGKIEYTPVAWRLGSYAAPPFFGYLPASPGYVLSHLFPWSLAPQNSSRVPYPCHPFLEGPSVQVQRGSELGMCALQSLRWGMIAAIPGLGWHGCTMVDKAMSWWERAFCPTLM